MTERKPFVIRCLHKEAKGKYFVDAHWEDGPRWTENREEAPRFSVGDAYGHIACLIDRCVTAAVPEDAGDATDAECDEFCRIAATDMFQSGETIRKLLIEFKAVRRSPDAPIVEPKDPPPNPDKTYMSVWEWVARATCAEIHRREEEKQRDADRADPPGE